MVELTPLLALGELFPRGVLPYLLGGLLVGAGASIIYLATGIIAGTSTFLESTLSVVSTLGPAAEPGAWTTDIQWWRLLGGGVFGVGWGISGICPGAAYASVGIGNWAILWAIAGMFLGAYAQAAVRSW